MKIFKYQLHLVNDQSIKMPVGTDILVAQVQDGVICLWAVVDEDAHNEIRKIYIVGTGHDVPLECQYISTVQLGHFVWHIFDGGSSL
jgi:hypothetical protein